MNREVLLHLAPLEGQAALVQLYYFTEVGIEEQDLVGCVRGYQLQEGFSMGIATDF